jgi:hypothetical protein
MTAQEQQMIDDLVQRVRSTQLADKDADAEQRLQQGLAGYPDAVYVLAQTVLVQKYGLEQAQQQIQALQAELDRLHQEQAAPTRSGGSFLSSLFGVRNAPPAPPQQQQMPVQPAYQPVNAPAYGAYPQPGVPMAYPQTGGGGGFLRSAMQTAAGVAMGEVAFQGMESLFHGFGGGGYGSGFGGGGFGEGRPSEVVNNYYGDGDEHHHDAADTKDDSSFYNAKDDASRDSDTGTQFADTSGNDRDDASGGNDLADSSNAGTDDDGDATDADFSSGDDGGSGGGDGGF